MEWIKLDITKASVVRSEVDKIVALLSKNSVESKDILGKVQQRIDELDLFCVRNDDDERSILFEKQKQRLRQALNSYNLMIKAQSKSTVTTTATPNNNESTPSKPITVFNTTDTSTAPTASVTKGAFSKPQLAINASSSPISPKIVNDTSSTHSPGAYSTSGKRQFKSRLYLNDRSYVPTNTTGYYKEETMSSDDHALAVDDGNHSKSFNNSNKYYDLQIVLTQEEFNVLVSRKKQMKSELKDYRNQYSSGSPNVSVPYIEPRKILREIYRPKKFDKWTGDRDFRPNMK